MQSKQIVDNAFSESFSGLLSHYRSIARIKSQERETLLNLEISELLVLVISRLDGLRNDNSIIVDNPSIDDLRQWLVANGVLTAGHSFVLGVIVPTTRKAHVR